MKISLAQLNLIIGDFEGNTLKITKAINEAKKRDVELIVFSELSVCGYPPLDLLEHKYFIEKSKEQIEKIAESCKSIAAIVGGPLLNSSPAGKNLFNSAFFLNEGKTEHIVNKTLLPTYDIFDEYRYFESNTQFKPIEFKGKKIAITICEDLWYEQPLLTGFGKDKLYTVNPIEKLVTQGADFIINIAASPFSYSHEEVKRNILTSNAVKYKIPVIYVNQVGANTDLIFDGGSMVVNSSGQVVKRMAMFNEDISDIDTDVIFNGSGKNILFDSTNYVRNIHDALILGIKDYFKKINFTKAVLGLSGGIDSAVTLAIAVKALGNKNVSALLMPSKYSSEHSVVDAVKITENLNVKYDIISIEKIVAEMEASLKPVFKDLPPDITEENIQARVRGNLLMAFSNKFGSLLLNTSNKSEAAVGYGTLYGDMSGGISVLGDVYKTDVYKLAEYINREEEIIPINTIKKPPSAELRPDQKDSDSLPDYSVLDIILFNYIERKKSAKEIISIGLDEDTVCRVIKLVNINEYKRYQAPPSLRISSKAFGTGRRMPIVAIYKH